MSIDNKGDSRPTSDNMQYVKSYGLANALDGRIYAMFGPCWRYPLGWEALIGITHTLNPSRPTQPNSTPLQAIANEGHK